jgi:predicted extracellular nuclease
VDFVGGDAIAVGFIFNADTVRLAPGTTPAILDDSDLTAAFLARSSIGAVFDGANTSRAVLAATFEEIATGGEFTAAINHFKSKGRRRHRRRCRRARRRRRVEPAAHPGRRGSARLARHQSHRLTGCRRGDPGRP